MKEEVDKCYQFLSTLRQGGTVHAALQPVFDNLRAQVLQQEEHQQALLGTSSALPSAQENGISSKDHQAVVIAAHKAMCQESFICIIEKASTVPGFAAALKGKKTKKKSLFTELFCRSCYLLIMIQQSLFRDHHLQILCHRRFFIESLLLIIFHKNLMRPNHFSL